MQIPPAKLKDAPFSENEGRQRVSLRNNKEDNVVNIIPDVRSEFRALIIDRDSMSSDVLAKVLVSHCRCEAVATSSGNLFAALSASKVDMVVVGADLNGKIGAGLDLAYKVSCAYPNTGIVILVNRSTREAVIHAFRSGARGVFSRQQPTSEFLDCVEDVRRGLIWAGREETNFLLNALRTIPAPNQFTSNESPTLTARELEVVRCAAEGKTNRVIAKDLGVSEHTVKNHLFRAFEKLGVSSRIELLFYLTCRGHTFSPTKSEDEDLNLS